MKRGSLTVSLAAIALLTGATAVGADATPSAAGMRNFDRASLMAEASASGFGAAEETYLTAAAAGEAPKIIGLARFYMANGLWVEALAALKRINGPSGSQALAAECHYMLARDRHVVAMLADAPGDPLLAMALTRLGAYGEARKAFQTAVPVDAGQNLKSDFFLLKAEALAGAGAADDAAAAIKLAGDTDNSAADRARRAFVAAMIHAARQETGRAAAAYRRAADAGTNQWSMRARVALAEEKNDVMALDALSLEWRGGAFERDVQLAIGRLRVAGNDFSRGLAALALVVDRFPESQAALDAQDDIATALPELFADVSSLHPKEAARLFFENVDFAPPGRDGDKLIQEAASKLQALGLYRQAAQILGHQVFKRLRGQDRAIVAADLANLNLLAGNPAEALRVIRSTRIAGLEEKDNQRRRLIEAQALAASGRGEEALTQLKNAPGVDGLLLRAEINWSNRAWPDAALDYASYFSASPSVAARSVATAGVRAATAFLLAGDRAGYRAFAKEAVIRLEGLPESDLIRTIGDVDQSQFLTNMMDSYRAVYSDNRS